MIRQAQALASLVARAPGFAPAWCAAIGAGGLAMPYNLLIPLVMLLATDDHSVPLEQRFSEANGPGAPDRSPPAERANRSRSQVGGSNGPGAPGQPPREDEEADEAAVRPVAERDEGADGRSAEIEDLLRRGAEEPRTHTFARLAALYREIGKLDQALEVVRRGLEHHPYYLPARLLRARVLREVGRDAAADAELARVLEIDSANAAAQAALDSSSALPAIPELPATRKVRRAGPPPAGAAAAWLARLDGDPGARRGAAAADDLASAIDTPTLAAVYIGQGLFSQAAGVYERLLAHDPDNANLAAALKGARRRASDGASG